MNNLVKKSLPLPWLRTLWPNMKIGDIAITDTGHHLVKVSLGEAMVLRAHLDSGRYYHYTKLQWLRVADYTYTRHLRFVRGGK